MSKVLLEIDVKEARELIGQMPLDDKIKLVKALEKETWQTRFHNLLYGIDRRLKSHSRLSTQKTVQIVKRVRRRANA